MRYLLALLLMVTGVKAASPSFSSFNTNQFSTNNLFISIKDGASVTNIYNTRSNPSLPSSVVIMSDLLWTNISSVIQPTIGNSVMVTNLSSYQTLAAAGAFILDSTYSATLDIGTNCVPTLNNGGLALTGQTTNPADTTFNLDQGNAQGQIMVIHNFSDNSAFTLLNGSPFCDGTPGGYVRLNGDWASTNKGDGLLLYNVAGLMWTEIARFSGNTNVSFAATTINPTTGYLPYRSNATTFADSSFYQSSDDVFYEAGGTNFVKLYRYGTDQGRVSVYSPSQSVVTDISSDNSGTSGFGSTGNITIYGTGYNVLFQSGNVLSTYTSDLGTTDYPWKNIHLSGTNFVTGFNTDTNYSRLELFHTGTNGNAIISSAAVGTAGTPRDILVQSNSTTVARINMNSGYTGAGTLFLSDDGTYKAGTGLGTTINPTDGYLPYRSNATTFADSPIYRVLPDTIAIGTLTNMLTASGGDLVYTNNTATAKLRVQTSAELAYFGLDSGGNAAIESSSSGRSVIQRVGLRNLVYSGTVLYPSFDNDMDIAGPLTSGWFKDYGFKGTGYMSGFEDDTNYSRLAFTHTGTNGNAIIKSISNGTAGTPRNILIQSNTTTVASISMGGGFVQHLLSSYLAADATSVDTTMANLSLSATVISGKKYSFVLTLFCANSTPADGIRVDFDGGTATATNFRAHSLLHDTVLEDSVQVSALATDIVDSNMSGDSLMVVRGAFEPSATGTFIPRFAEEADGGGTLTIYRGSNLILTEIP